MVYKLQKAISGLKQAPKTSFSRKESYFIKKGFKSNSMSRQSSSRGREVKLLMIIYLLEIMKNYWSLNVS